MNGADTICQILRELGVTHVFGLPGTQNVRLYEALRTSGLRSVVAADEGGAAFMAAGYAKASGNVGVLLTIPGPGFMFALAGVVEAQHDSLPLVWLTLRQEDSGRAFQLQRIDQRSIARPVVKHALFAASPADLAATIVEAFRIAQSDEPGPVLLEVAAHLLAAGIERGPVAVAAAEPQAEIATLRSILQRAAWPVLMAGQGAQGAAAEVRRLAEQLHAPVIFTSSGRGVLPDDHPLSFVQDFSTGLGPVLPGLLERADAIVVLGCKLTHNGSYGGSLQLPQDKLIRVDASADVLTANYPARVSIHGRVEDVVGRLNAESLAASRWDASELDSLRGKLVADRRSPIDSEPVLQGASSPSIGAFFESMARAAGDSAVYVTDAGLHQALTRRHAVIARVRGLLCPSDFQSMGFGLPGAIGAALARPDARVFACIGDAGFVLSAGELQTAMREGVDLAIIVFNDRQMNLIRRQQVSTFGHESGVRVAATDYAALAAAVGCSYIPVNGDLDAVAVQVVATPGVRLVELRLDDVASLHWGQVKTIVRERALQLLPAGFWQTLKRALRR